MRVSIGMRLQEGPWGGGNQFGKALADAVRLPFNDGVFDAVACTESHCHHLSLAALPFETGI